MKEQAQIGSVEGSARLEGSEEPARIGRPTERPTRLENGDFVEAVSQAVLRELEGGTMKLPLPIPFGILTAPDPSKLS